MVEAVYNQHISAQEDIVPLTALRNWLHSPQSKKWLWLILLVVLVLAALVEFFTLGLARRTFVFYALDSGDIRVEERNLRVSDRNSRAPERSITHSSARELDITRYVEEAILGSVLPDTLPLFPRDTKLRSLLYRNGVVYVDLSDDAALPPLEGGEVFHNLETLHSGIRRNFSSVKEVRFFISGRAAYTGIVF